MSNEYRSYGHPTNAKCFIAFQLPDGLIMTYQGWASDIAMDANRDVDPQWFDLTRPYHGGPLTYKFTIVMHPQSFNEERPNWGNIHRPPEIENRKELE